MDGVSEKILAWHFCAETLRDGRPIPADGETLTHEGEIRMCASGLHASRRIIEALKHAPGNTICRVECWGDVIEDDAKLVARHRRILWRLDGKEVLRQFARQAALSVIHLWDAPDVVRQFLETGEEALRDAAWAAAADASRGAAWDAAWAAAADAARGAALGAAWDAARYAARYAALGAAWDAAWAAARYAADGAAWDAADGMLAELVEAERRRHLSR